jgi:predicted metal-binding protein
LADGSPHLAGMVQLLVCTTCRHPQGDPADPRAGAVLAGVLATNPPPGVQVVPVECLSNCSQGCTVALRGTGRWTYIYCNLDPAQHLPALAEGAAKYRAASDGLVPWRERPEHFRKNCIARIPPLEPVA